MSTAPGRRVQVDARLGRTAIFSLVVVGLTIGMLTLAGTTPLGIGRAIEDPSRVQLDQRIFSCTGGIAGATIRSGNLTDAAAPLRTAPASPVTIVADREVAAGAFAGQQVVAKKSLAWLPCPEPQARWWFVAAGGADVTHDTVLTLTNPRPGEASVDIDVYGPDGLVDSPDFRNVAIPALGTRVIDLSKTAPAIGNLTVSVLAKRGLVAVSAVDRYAPGTVHTPAVEWLPPQSLPSRSITLAGIPGDHASPTLVVANPNEVEAIVKVEVISTTGTFTPKGLEEFTVGPDSVKSIALDAVLDGSPVALRLTSAQRVTATVRSVKSGDTSFATGVRVLRGGAAFAVPDGTAQLVLSSLDVASTVRVVAYDGNGTSLVGQELKVPARSSLQFTLPSTTRYVRLESSRPSIVAGFSVIGSSGIASAGVTSSLRSVRLPEIRPAW